MLAFFTFVGALIVVVLGVGPSEPSRYVVRTENAVGHATERIEDVWGNEQHRTDINGNSSVTLWDGRHRAIETARVVGTQRVRISDAAYTDGADPKAITTTYHDDGRVDAKTTTFFDAWGAPIQTHRDLGDRSLVDDVDYRADGQPHRKGVTYTEAGTNPRVYLGFEAGFASSLTYDPIGRWAATIDPLGKRTSEETGDPWASVIVDAEGFENHKDFDAYGQVVGAWAATATDDLAPADYRYDAAGRLVEVTDPDGIVTTYTWSSLGELLRVASPDIGYRAYAYDADGNVVEISDAAGRVVRYQRDAIGRVLSKSEGTATAQSTVETYTWDTLKAGKLTSVADAAGLVTYTYDALARVASETRRFTDLTTATRTFAYDLQDRIVRETEPDGVAIATVYAHGRVEAIDVTLSGGRTPPVHRVAVRYDDAGRYQGFSAAALGASLTLDHDLVGRITKMAWSLANPLGNVSATHTYAYRGNGLVKSRRLNTTSALPTVYDYDPAGRVVNATGRGAAMWSLSAGGDAFSRTGTAPVGYLTDLASHRITSITDYDEVPPEGVAYAFDRAGNVVEVTRTRKAKVTERLVLGYDGLGRPTSIVDTVQGGASTVRQYAWDGAVVYETIDGKAIKRLGPWEDDRGEAHTRVSLGGYPVFWTVRGKALQVVFTDVQGTPTAMYDAAAVPVNTLESDIYGVQLASTGKLDGGHQWLGLPRSAKLGVVLTNARVFDERSRMFLSPDPVLLGVPGPMTADPYLLNPYAYSRWNGANLTDRSGRMPDEREATDQTLQFASAITNGVGAGAQGYPILHMPDMLRDVASELRDLTASSGLENGGIYYITSSGREGFIVAKEGVAATMGNHIEAAAGALPADTWAAVTIHSHPAVLPNQGFPSANDINNWTGHSVYDAMAVTSARSGPLGVGGTTSSGTTFLTYSGSPAGVHEGFVQAQAGYALGVRYFDAQPDPLDIAGSLNASAYRYGYSVFQASDAGTDLVRMVSP